MGQGTPSEGSHSRHTRGKSADIHPWQTFCLGEGFSLASDAIICFDYASSSCPMSNITTTCSGMRGFHEALDNKMIGIPNPTLARINVKKLW